jgi:hypothetical protein
MRKWDKPLGLTIQWIISIVNHLLGGMVQDSKQLGEPWISKWYKIQITFFEWTPPSDILSDIYSDILSGILSDMNIYIYTYIYIYYDILSAFYLTYILTFYLAFFPTFNILRGIYSAWHSFRMCSGRCVPNCIRSSRVFGSMRHRIMVLIDLGSRVC